MKQLAAVLIGFVLLRSVLWAAEGGALTWDALAKSYRAKPGEEKADFVFVALNRSSDKVVVTSVTTSCGCTVAGFPTMPCAIGSGQASELHVVIDFKGKWGKVEKTIEVDSSAGHTTLTIRVDAGDSPPKVDVASLLMRAAKIPVVTTSAPSSSPLVASRELVAAIQSIANESDGFLRYQRTEELVDSLPEKDFPLVLNMMLLPGSDTTGLIDLSAKVFRRWTEIAPDRAVTWLRHMPDDTTLGRELFAVAGEAEANANPAAALGWLKTMPEGGNRVAAEFAVASVLARRDPRTALSLALELPSSTSRGGLISYCVLNWSVSDFDGAARWIGDLADLSQRDAVAVRLAAQEATTDAPRAARFAVSMLRPGELQNRCLSQVVRFWTAAAPGKAAEWVSALPAGALRDAAARALVETWARADRAGVQQWLAACTADDLRQIGEAALASVPANPDRTRTFAPRSATASRSAEKRQK